LDGITKTKRKEQTNMQINKSEIRKRILERKKTVASLKENADFVGSCWESQKLGFTEGYIYALEELLGGGSVDWDFMGK
jgi:hypothetical protein